MLTATLREPASPATTNTRGVRTAMTVSLSLLLVAFWVLMHRYSGLAKDARVYAIQALSRLRPYLGADLYLQNTSQDQFTVFSPFYARFIAWMGLENSALLLTVIFTLWFMTAAWTIGRKVGGYALAWASVAALVFTTGDYGAFRVFHFPEAYLTARLPAYALVATAVALHLADYKRLGFCVGAIALLVHPIMALPGLLLLLCLTFPVRMSLIGAVAGIVLTFAIAVAAATLPWAAHVITIIDPPWLEVVRERSEFLFLQLWPARDFVFNARPFLCLAVTAMVLVGTRERRLCYGALMIGATGLLVAFIGGTIGPVALLVQGQAWRWEWITCFIAVLLLPQTVWSVWHDKKCGPICSLLLICAWMFPVLDGTLSASLALVLWLVRGHITTLIGRYLRWAAMAFAAVIVAWVAATSWDLVASPYSGSGHESVVLTTLRNILGLSASACVLFGLLSYWIMSRRTGRPLFVSSAILVAGLCYAVPRTFEPMDSVDSESYVAEFADWRSVIPPTSTVLVAPAQDAGRFVWFSLQRPNYSSPDQSAGVVFSRTTALEVRRRSVVLLPIEGPNWKFFSARSQSGAAKAEAERHNLLTTQQLASVCGDPILGFVMTKEIAGMTPLRHMDHGRWRGWDLYDCQTLRMQRPGA